MKRYVLFFSNGYIVQQDGLNSTYVYMMQIGQLVVVIDTKEGKIIKDKNWQWTNIPSYDSSDLVKDFNDVNNE